MSKPYADREVWFLTGSQSLYGEETLRQVAAVVLYPLQQAAQIPGAALAQVGAHFAAQRALADLKRLEPDFTLDRIREDPSYPAGTLRRARLLKISFPDQQ